MRAIKKFEEFIREGIVRQQSLDKSRAEFLIKEAEQNYNYLFELINKIGVHDNNANNFLKNCYDILMGLIRANMLLNGYNASGTGAHEAEVSYMRNLGFSENDVQFADQMRFFRNGILYYGKIFDKEYAKKVLDFLNKIHPQLKKLVEK